MEISCKSCGKKSEYNAKFCPFCGKRIVSNPFLNLEYSKCYVVPFPEADMQSDGAVIPESHSSNESNRNYLYVPKIANSIPDGIYPGERIPMYGIGNLLVFPRFIDDKFVIYDWEKNLEIGSTFRILPQIKNAVPPLFDGLHFYSLTSSVFYRFRINRSGGVTTESFSHNYGFHAKDIIPSIIEHGPDSLYVFTHRNHLYSVNLAQFNEIQEFNTDDSPQLLSSIIVQSETKPGALYLVSSTGSLLEFHIENKMKSWLYHSSYHAITPPVFQGNRIMFIGKTENSCEVVSYNIGETVSETKATIKIPNFSLAYENEHPFWNRIPVAVDGYLLVFNRYYDRQVAFLRADGTGEVVDTEYSLDKDDKIQFHSKLFIFDAPHLRMYDIPSRSFLPQTIQFSGHLFSKLIYLRNKFVCVQLENSILIQDIKMFLTH